MTMKRKRSGTSWSILLAGVLALFGCSFPSQSRFLWTQQPVLVSNSTRFPEKYAAVSSTQAWTQGDDDPHAIVLSRQEPAQDDGDDDEKKGRGVCICLGPNEHNVQMLQSLLSWLYDRFHFGLPIELNHRNEFDNTQMESLLSVLPENLNVSFANLEEHLKIQTKASCTFIIRKKTSRMTLEHLPVVVQSDDRGCYHALSSKPSSPSRGRRGGMTSSSLTI